MSIEFRLNALFSALLLLTLAAITVTLIAGAAPRIRAEEESIVRLTSETIASSLEALQHAPDPRVGLDRLLARFDGLRHIQVSLEPKGTSLSVPGHSGPKPTPRSSWLASLFVAQPDPVRLPVTIRGQDLGTLVIAPQAADELAELSDAISGVTLSGLMLALAVIALIHWVVGRALNPITELARAMRRMEAGDFDIGVSAKGAPEIAAIANGLNDLAAALRVARDENRRLAGKLVRLQDDERKEIARELHDELGPYLFAVRAGGTSLKSEAEKSNVDQEKMSRLAVTMLEQIEAIQATNKRVLRKLNPVGLAEVGLAATLEGVLSLWRKDHPSTQLVLDTAGDVDGLDDTTTLTTYRVVQEGVTNAFRHARATRIEVAVTLEEEAGEPRGARGRVRVTVCDDGVGVGGSPKRGFGLTSMRERVEALGGSLAMRSPPQGGTIVDAEFPAVRKSQRAGLLVEPRSGE